MTDAPDRLTPAAPDDLADALAFALRFDGRKRKHDAAEMMALLDRLTHHVHIPEMNGDSCRLNQSKRRSRRASSDTPADNPAHD